MRRLGFLTGIVIFAITASIYARGLTDSSLEEFFAKRGFMFGVFTAVTLLFGGLLMTPFSWIKNFIALRVIFTALAGFFLWRCVYTIVFLLGTEIDPVFTGIGAIILGLIGVVTVCNTAEIICNKANKSEEPTPNPPSD